MPFSLLQDQPGPVRSRGGSPGRTDSAMREATTNPEIKAGAWGVGAHKVMVQAWGNLREGIDRTVPKLQLQNCGLDLVSSSRQSCGIQFRRKRFAGAHEGILPGGGALLRWGNRPPRPQTSRG